MRAPRRKVGGHAAGTGPEVLERVLGVDAALDGVALDLHVLLLDRQPRTHGHLDLLLDQVDAGDHLGDRVLDLRGEEWRKEVWISVGAMLDINCSDYGTVCVLAWKLDLGPVGSVPHPL